MRNIVAALLLLVTSPAWAWSTVPEYEADFAKARECTPIDGRKVWAGERAYYIQAWLLATGDSGLLDDENASVVDVSENTPDALAAFTKACE